MGSHRLLLGRYWNVNRSLSYRWYTKFNPKPMWSVALFQIAQIAIGRRLVEWGYYWIRPLLVHRMACHLYGTKPLSEPMMDYCWTLRNKCTEISTKMEQFPFKKLDLKISSPKYWSFFLCLMCVYIQTPQKAWWLMADNIFKHFSSINILLHWNKFPGVNLRINQHWARRLVSLHGDFF